MIHVPRRPKAVPPKLAANREKWTGRWKALIVSTPKTGRDKWATSAAKRFLKESLQGMAYGKCVFCEGLLGAQAHVEVEHYIAKTVDVEQAFEWANLFPACCKCNVAKGHTDHRGVLLKPDEDDPEEYFAVHPNGELQLRPHLTPDQRERAHETIRICDLQRGALKTLRSQALVRCGEWIQNGGPENRADDLLEPNRQYKLAIRHQLRTYGRSDLVLEDRSRFESFV